jgi:hypothetical protein
MRQILMSKPGEFSYKMKTDYLRGAAVKMLASVIQKPENHDIKENKVIVSNKALQQTSR